MASGSFTIGSQSNDIVINHENVSGHYDGFNAFLNLPVKFEVARPSSPGVALDFTSIIAKLYSSNTGFAQKEVLMSESFIPCNEHVHGSDKKFHHTFNFSLPQQTIHVLEKLRNGSDLNLIIKFVFVTQRRSKLQGLGLNDAWSLDGFITAQGEIRFTIPRSYWIEKVMPCLGFPGFSLIEIPLSHKLLVEAYNDIIKEFNSAEKYFRQGDYTKCIGHCRHTMDHLSTNLKKIKSNVDSESMFKWLSRIDEKTLAWIDDVNKALSSIGSRPHHIGLKKEFTRYEAESIYLITLGLMNFVGNCSKEHS